MVDPVWTVLRALFLMEQKRRVSNAAQGKKRRATRARVLLVEVGSIRAGLVIAWVVHLARCLSLGGQRVLNVVLGLK
tara:strand:- start:346 stop:576 length:231 start_codon:yes stop_codon:yes gene_type:complete